MTTRGAAGKPKVDRFDSSAAWRLLGWQVDLGPRPAGSAASSRLARRFRRLLPRGRYQPVPGGLRNVVGHVPGRNRSYVVVGAHYDTKDIPGFVGANDGACGTAVVVQLARAIKPRRLRKTVVFVLFDGEESPAGTPTRSSQAGLRGSRVAARRYRRGEAMVLLDFVGEKRLRIRREAYSNPRLWRKLRRAARRGSAPARPSRPVSGRIADDHLPFRRRGVPSIDLIDFDFPCWHDLRRPARGGLDAEESLDAGG